MNSYYLFKWIHVITAALWATGLWGLINSHLLRRNDMGKDSELCRPPLWPSLCIGLALLAQPISGFMMILLHAQTFNAEWASNAWGSYGLTLIGSLWLVSASWQKKSLLLPLLLTLVGALSALWVMTALPSV